MVRDIVFDLQARARWGTEKRDWRVGSWQPGLALLYCSLGGHLLAQAAGSTVGFQAYDLQQLRPRSQAPASHCAASLFSLAGHSLGVAGEPQGSELFIPHSAKWRTPFSPHPTHPSGQQTSQKCTSLAVVGFCAAQPWDWLMRLVGVCVFSPSGSQGLNNFCLSHTKGCSAQKASACWAGRSHGCHWLKGKVWRGQQLRRDGGLEGWSVEGGQVR